LAETLAKRACFSVPTRRRDVKANSRNHFILVAALALPVLFLLALGGCTSERDQEYIANLPPASADVDPVVFDDAFGANVDYFAFENSHYKALSQEPSGGYNDSATLKVSIAPPTPGVDPSDPDYSGGWAGGSFWTHVARDLSSFNSLTFWAKANEPLALSECGLGIPLDLPATYQITVSGTPLDTSFKKVIIPIPNPGRLTVEQGMFWYSHGEHSVQIWMDEVIYSNETGILNPRPSMRSETKEALLDEEVTISDTKTIYSVNGVDVEVAHGSAYFDLFSSDESVVSVENGVATAIGGGTATITAMLMDTPVEGEVTVTVIAPPNEPAPTPTPDQADVLSIFSDAYTNNITVTSWRTDWSSAATAVYDQQIQGDNVKAYTGLTSNAYVGIDFSDDQIDATSPGMTHFTLDVFAPAGATLLVKLVDFGPDGAFGGGDDTEKGLTFHAGTVPPFTTGQWVSLDIPLTDFTGMNFGNVAQMVLQSINVGNVWVDNIYFRK
jgi:hypothetical protein